MKKLLLLITLIGCTSETKQEVKELIPTKSTTTIKKNLLNYFLTRSKGGPYEPISIKLDSTTSVIQKTNEAMSLYMALESVSSGKIKTEYLRKVDSTQKVIQKLQLEGKSDSVDTKYYTSI